MIERKENGGSVTEYEGGGEAVSATEPLALDVDVPIPVPLGGVITREKAGAAVSYFEWVQSAQNMSWEEEPVSEERERRMMRAYHRGSDQAESGPSLRHAAFRAAVRKADRATELRGL